VKTHIDSYQFGEIVIDGVSYTIDCIIIGGIVQANWWRKEGHSLSIEDLQTVIATKPAVLVVGCGASGFMKVPQETRQVLQEHNIKLEAMDTHKAVRRFIELMRSGANVATAALLRNKYPQLAQVVRKHRYTAISHQKDKPVTWEEKLVYYADKRVMHDRIVSLKKRLEEAHKRYADWCRANARSSLDTVKIDRLIYKLEKEIFAKIGLPCVSYKPQTPS